MKYIKNYKVFENNEELTDNQKVFLYDCIRGEWKLNPDTGLIDVQGSFHGSSRDLNDFKGIQFGKVSGGSFYCSNNNLKTLDGSPREVSDYFSCKGNPLISLEEAPLEVGYYFRYDNFVSEYNLTAFLEEIKKDRPGVPTELLLTHHFFTPEVIKQKIQEDDDFLLHLFGVCNSSSFQKKQVKLTRILSPEILQKMNYLLINKIEQDDDFCISFCKYWNTPEFKTKQDELTRTLRPETLQKIKDFSAISGYL